jgi:hypothetical protein
MWSYHTRMPQCSAQFCLRLIACTWEERTRDQRAKLMWSSGAGHATDADQIKAFEGKYFTINIETLILTLSGPGLSFNFRTVCRISLILLHYSVKELTKYKNWYEIGNACKFMTSCEPFWKMCFKQLTAPGTSASFGWRFHLQSNRFNTKVTKKLH